MVIQLLGMATLIAMAFLVAYIARRVLGVPIGWPRSILVGLIMIASLGTTLPWIAFQSGLVEPIEDNRIPVGLLLIFILVLAWGFFLAIAVLVVAELIIPTGTIPTPWRVLRSTRERFRRFRRYVQVVAIAVRHGLGGFLRPRAKDRVTGLAAETRTASVARSLRRALNDAGVTFIKIGQMLSARPDLVPDVFVRELSQLQSSTSAVPWQSIKPVIEAGIGCPVEEVFSEIDPDPLAAASVAQVHTAVLLSGESVVVKVQRPGARAQVTADLDIVGRLADRLERSTAWARELGVRRLAEGFAASLREELDYRVEADNMIAVAAATRADSEIIIPRVYPEFSGETILVQERLVGTPIGSSTETLAALPAETRTEAAQRLLGAVLDQIMLSGVFHADLHPGNVVIEPDGRLGLLDFGSVGRLDDHSRDALGLLLLAVDRNNSIAATDALVEILERPEEPLNEKAMEREVGQLIVRYRSGTSTTGGMFGHIFGLVRRYGFAIPGQVAAAFRALAALEGTCRLIDPKLDLVQVARTHGGEIFAAAANPNALREQLDSELLHLLPLIRRLPRRVNKISEDLERGRLSINLRLLSDQSDRAFILGVAHQVIVAVLASAATLAAIIMITATGGPTLTGTSIQVFPLIGACLLFVGFVLALRSLVLIFRRE
ncbi:ABC1 kinase family protein [Microlunatus speluncae]|uniref:ABC1 kinase family protein n=1 Tax=Microlunatus speluncae TaxID=2594267 RepID=UPI001C2CEA65|nr:AarF/UbiB family protein [Microlunatus speluncae]